MEKNYIQDYFDFMKKATSSYHVIIEAEKRLVEAGYEKVEIENRWSLTAGGKYYVKPYDSMLTAFTMPNSFNPMDHFKIITSHVDSPGLKIKPAPCVVANNYIKLNTEVYSGPLIHTWFDRPLSIAGKVALKSEDVLHPEVKFIDFQKPMAYLPSLAIHMIRDKAKAPEVDRQKDLIPTIALLNNEMEKDQYLLNLISKELEVEVEDILDFDLFVYVAEEGCLVGADESMVVCPRIDDVAMVYASLNGHINGETGTGVNVVTFFDNEDVGSRSLAGADSEMLPTILEKIVIEFKQTREQYQRMLVKSFMISADGAHAIHPTAPEKNDITNIPKLNEGIIIKLSGKKAYATDCETSGAIQQLCEKIGIKHQKYVNNNNVPGGMTLGPIVNTHLPIKAVDLGTGMLAMHSAKELMGKEDFKDVIHLFTEFYKL